MTELQFKGTTALVTGAASGIGRAAARSFAAEGASVVLWDIDTRVRDVGRAIADDLHVGTRAEIVDITDGDAVQVAGQNAGPTGDSVVDSVDHVIHCAAVGSGKFGFPFTRLQPSDWARVLQVNVMGMVHIAHRFAPSMIARKRGSFVFVASVAGQIGSQTDPPYSASKAANISFAQCMAKDLAPHNVRVNTVCPGMVQTPLNRSVWEAWCATVSESDRLSYEQWAESKIRSVVPLQRWQSCEDVASMIVFLASARASQITGQTINVDGGQVMHW
ncbi:MAG: SDR family NAD(P)-dependent oxidoreductase [Planctomycetota bacterium]|jgi:2-hydroxycyclohexanecarboxyl-CoA dehydrogenase